MSDIAAPEEDIPELEETQQVDDIISSEPLPPKVLETGKVEPETIEIVNKAAVLPYVKPQKSKFWHFEFTSPDNQNKLSNVLTSSNDSLTVEYGETQKSPDIMLKRGSDIVGKIHLLLCDRRDANLPEKYYVKLYFYDFVDNELYDNVKKNLINFFENFKSNASQQGGKKKRRLHRTMKKRRVNRKKTHRRK
jgi:hypothetical protein